MVTTSFTDQEDINEFTLGHMKNQSSNSTQQQVGFSFLCFMHLLILFQEKGNKSSPSYSRVAGSLGHPFQPEPSV